MFSDNFFRFYAYIFTFQPLLYSESLVFSGKRRVTVIVTFQNQIFPFYGRWKRRAILRTIAKRHGHDHATFSAKNEGFTVYSKNHWFKFRRVNFYGRNVNFFLPF
jgi:hypothetical protein